jgi:hypothetical protein
LSDALASGQTRIGAVDASTIFLLAAGGAVYDHPAAGQARFRAFPPGCHLVGTQDPSMQRNHLGQALLFAAAVATLVAAASAADKFRYIDLEPKSNLKVDDNLGSGLDGNNLANLPTGEQTLADVKFNLGPGMLQLGSKLLPGRPEKIEGIAVDKKFNKLHILHACCWGRNEGTVRFVKDGTLIGEYIVHYDDKSQEGIPIVYGEDIRDWFFDDSDAEPTRAKVAWKGDNPIATQVDCRIRLYDLSWTNPKRDKTVIQIDYVGRKDDTAAAPFCVAMSVED